MSACQLIDSDDFPKIYLAVDIWKKDIRFFTKVASLRVSLSLGVQWYLQHLAECDQMEPYQNGGKRRKNISVFWADSTGTEPDKLRCSLSHARHMCCYFGVFQEGAYVLTHMTLISCTPTGISRTRCHLNGDRDETKVQTGSLGIPLLSWWSKALKITWNHKQIVWTYPWLFYSCISLRCHENVWCQTKRSV